MEDFKDYDKWKLANGLEDKEDVVHVCAECENNIHKHEEYYWSELGRFCDTACFFEYCKEYHSGNYRIAGEK